MRKLNSNEHGPLLGSAMNEPICIHLENRPAQPGSIRIHLFKNTFFDDGAGSIYKIKKNGKQRIVGRVDYALGKITLVSSAMDYTLALSLEEENPEDKK